MIKRGVVNPSTPQHNPSTALRTSCWGLPFDKLKAPSKAEGLWVDPERRFLSPPSKAGPGAAEWVKLRVEVWKFINYIEKGGLRQEEAYDHQAV
jgi:hypothetical protein